MEAPQLGGTGIAFIPHSIYRDGRVSPCESLELSGDSGDDTSSQAESDLSLVLSNDGNQQEDVLLHDEKDVGHSIRKSSWQEGLKRAVSYHNDEDDNQREDGGNQLDDDSSDHSINESEPESVQDDLSLSLSQSSSSDDGQPVQWLESEPSQSSDTGGEVMRAVLISSDDDRSVKVSSSSDARWLSDSSSKCSRANVPDWVDDQDEDHFWLEFDAALQTHAEHNPLVVVDTDHSTAIVDDEDYDASVSASSLDDSDDEEYLDDKLYVIDSSPIFQPRLSVGYDTSTSNGEDSLASLPLSSSAKTNSSVSSLNFQSSDDQIQLPDPLLDLLSSSCDEDVQTKGSRWIENIPVVSPCAAFGVVRHDDLSGGLERPRTWRQDEYIIPEGFGTRQRRGPGTIHVDAQSVESLSDIEEDAPKSPTLATKTVPHLKTQHHDSDLHGVDSYVSYSDLAGVLEQFAPRHPAVIIDLGCGTSRLCAELVFHGHRFVYGIDHDPAVIDFQRRSSAAADLKDFVQFLPMDVCGSLAFPDEFSDLIISKAMFDEIATRCLREKEPRDLLYGLNEAIRCIKPGGILTVVAFQDGYISNGTNPSEMALIPDDATPVERVSYRLESPWWKWPEVSELLASKLTLMAQHGLGRPSLRDGNREIPYCVLVWRRKETKTQRLSRIACEIRAKQRMEREYDVGVQLLSARIQREMDEEKMVIETRQMILEDELAKLHQRIESQTEALRLRVERRKAFYAALLEEERTFMSQEDAAGTLRREYDCCVMNMINELVCQIIEVTVVAVPVAPTTTAPYVAKTPCEDPTSKARSTEQTPTVVTKAQPTDTSVWVREIVQAMGDTPIDASASKMLLKPVQRRRRAQNTAQAVAEPAPETGQRVVTDEAPPVVGTAESRSIEGPREVAQHRANWIISHAMASFVQASASTMTPALPDESPIHPTPDRTAPEIIQETQQAPHEPTPQTPSQAKPATPPERAQQHSNDGSTPSPASTDSSSNGDPQRRAEEPIAVHEGEVQVCKAVLEAIVDQVSKVNQG